MSDSSESLEFIGRGRSPQRGKEVEELDEEEKQVAKYVGAEEAMGERAMEARALRMANIPFRIPDEQIPVNLSLEAVRQAQRADAECEGWRAELEKWAAAGSKIEKKPAAVRQFVMSGEGVLMRLTYIASDIASDCREVLRPIAPVVSLRPFIMKNYHSSICRGPRDL